MMAYAGKLSINIDDILMKTLQGYEIDWNYISNYYDFDQDFALYFVDKLSWKNILFRKDNLYKAFDFNLFIDKFNQYDLWIPIVGLYYDMNFIDKTFKYFKDSKDVICMLAYNPFLNEYIINKYLDYFLQDSKTAKKTLSHYPLSSTFIENNFDKIKSYFPTLIYSDNLNYEYFVDHFDDFTEDQIVFMFKYQNECGSSLYELYDDLKDRIFTNIHLFRRLAKIHAISYLYLRKNINNLTQYNDILKKEMHIGFFTRLRWRLGMVYKYE